MLPKPKFNMRQLSALVTLFAGLAVVIVGWAVWRVTATSGVTESGPQDTISVAAPTLPAPATPSAEAQPKVTAGDALAPDFSLTLFDTGETVTLSGWRGQPVILDFFASWCPSCQAEAPGLQEFWQAYAGRGLKLLGVAFNDSAEGLRVFKDDFLLTYPMGLDETGKIATAYRASSIPTFVFIDREGHIANVVVGPMSKDKLAAEAEALLK